MEQDHYPERFERVGEIFKCRKCRKEKSQHALIINCPIQESPQKKQCFKCQGTIIRPYVFAKKRYSLKNDWDYWTEKEENQGKHICNSCLLDLYYNNKLQYLQEVQNPKKRDIFKVYVHNKTIT